MGSKEFYYTIYIRHGGKWIDTSGTHAYVGEDKPFVIPWENMDYEFFSTLATIYCDLIENSAPLYLPPNGNSNTDWVIISHEKDLPQVLESEGSSQNIKMYIRNNTSTIQTKLYYGW